MQATLLPQVERLRYPAAAKAASRAGRPEGNSTCLVRFQSRQPGNSVHIFPRSRTLPIHSPRYCVFSSVYLRSSGLSPVCLAIRDSIRGPISSRSWNAKVKSGQPGRQSTRCDVPDWRLTAHPMRKRAANTKRAFVDGHWLMPVSQTRHGVPGFPHRCRGGPPEHAAPAP